MPRIYEVELEASQRETLEEMRNHHPKAYLREKAAAILKVAEGQTIQAVAGDGLLRRREWETVAGWVKGYVSGGLGRLYVLAGRGRKPAFFPSDARADEGKNRDIAPANAQ
jgi:hypothetical protein